VGAALASAGIDLAGGLVSSQVRKDEALIAHLVRLVLQR